MVFSGSFITVNFSGIMNKLTCPIPTAGEGTTFLGSYF
jgi:hypothetical protein